ncbi:MAG TPA: hypothetical protein VMH50_13960 [Thermoleophilia bacterium]|nr:hypothetical protein [Thermoleophilia bacterium]
MSRERTPGVAVTEDAHAGSALGRLLSPILAVVAQLLLLDAAVETFWSGSPLRWRIAPAVVAFVALSVWLWRPGGILARRGGWAMAAATSVSGLLLLFVATAWLPGGQSDGVRMLAQPTPVLLAFVTALAVALAAFVLLRVVTFLPATPRLVTRAVVLALAAYAIVALGLGVRDHTPYASLFHGGALWHRLPSWLQGAFIGALVLLPLAILGQVARIIGEFGRKRPLRVLLYQTTALVMAFVMAASGIVMPSPVAQGGKRPMPPELAAGYAVFDKSRSDLVSLLARGDGSAPGTSKMTADRIDAMVAALDDAIAKLPRDTFDADAVVAQVGREPSALFEWVRNHTYWVPYQGALRGPTGVLMDRLGNSLDRALLLAALLKAAGGTPRLARATLTREQAQSFLSQVQPVPENPSGSADKAPADAMSGLTDRYAQRFGVAPASLRARLEQSQQAAKAIASRSTDQSERQAAALLALVGRRATVGSNDVEQAATDHWWVQVEDSGSWRDLDPNLSKAPGGTALLPAVETMAPEELPAALRHEVEIRVVVEQSLSGHLEQHVALAQTLHPSDLIGQTVALQHLPLSLTPDDVPLKAGANVSEYLAQAAAREDRWLPVLQVGDEYQNGKVITTDGRLADLSPAGAPTPPNAATAGAGDLSGFLGGSEGGEQKPAAKAEESAPGNGQLTAEWIEYEIRAPGETARKMRREIFDELGPIARAANDARLTATDAQRLDRGLALMSRTEILALPCRLSPEFVLWLKANAFVNNRAVLSDLLRNAGTASPKELADQAAKLTIVPERLYDLELTRYALNPHRQDVFLAVPNVLSFHRGFRPGTRGGLTAFQSLDIVANDVAVHAGRPRAPFDARVRQGTYDTNAETVVLRGSCCGAAAMSAASEFEAAQASGERWTAVARRESLESLRVPADAKARLAADLDAGYMVVAPPSVAPGQDIVWWRIDPESGRTLGIGPHGWGQATTETAINHWLHEHPGFAIGIKFFMVMVCLVASTIPMLNRARSGEEEWLTTGNAVGLVSCLFGFAAGGMAVALEVGELGWMAIVIDVLGIGVEQYEEYEEAHVSAERVGIK